MRWSELHRLPQHPGRIRAAVLLCGLLLLPVPALAAWQQATFTIASWWDPCITATDPADAVGMTADSLSLEHFKSLGFNLMMGNQRATSGVQYAFVNTQMFASRTRLCRNVGLRTLFDVRNEPKDGCYGCANRAEVSLPQVFPACLAANDYIPPAEHCDTNCTFRIGRDLPPTSRPGLEGYFLAHEPRLSPAVEAAKAAVQVVHSIDPKALGFFLISALCRNNVGVNAHLDSVWLDADLSKRPDVVSFDSYPFRGKTGATISSCHFFNLKANRDRAGDRPVWVYVQSTAGHSVPFDPITRLASTDTLWLPEPTPGQLRFSTFTALAYGVKGVIYFTYQLPPSDVGCCGQFWTSAIANACNDVTETPKKAMIRTLNRHLRDVSGPLIMGSRYVGTYHDSALPTKETVDSGAGLKDQDGLVAGLPDSVCMVGVLRDSSNAGTAYLLIVNKDSNNGVSGAVDLRSDVSANLSVAPSIVGYTGGMSWSNVPATFSAGQTRFTVSLAAGEGRWYRVQNVSAELFARPAPIARVDDSVHEGPGLRLTAHPTPFRDRTTIYLTNPRAQHVRVGIFNVRGQQVRELLRGPREAGVQALPWDGSSDSGTRVPAGVYFCRAESMQGDTVTRVVIVGRP